MRRDMLSKFINDFVENNSAQGAYDWDAFISVKHKDPFVDAASHLASSIGIMFPPDHDDMWWSEDGTRRLRALAYAVSFE